MLTNAGSIRLGNKRANASSKPVYGETVVHIDSTNPVLGNPYILRDHRDHAARANVISRYKVKYENDIANHGQMDRATHDLAKKVRNGERLILMCWCHPLPCHGNLIVGQVQRLLQCQAV